MISKDELSQESDDEQSPESVDLDAVEAPVSLDELEDSSFDSNQASLDEGDPTPDLANMPFATSVVEQIATDDSASGPRTVGSDSEKDMQDYELPDEELSLEQQEGLEFADEEPSLRQESRSDSPLARGQAARESEIGGGIQFNSSEREDIDLTSVDQNQSGEDSSNTESGQPAILAEARLLPTRRKLKKTPWTRCHLNSVGLMAVTARCLHLRLLTTVRQHLRMPRFASMCSPMTTIQSLAIV